MLRLMMGLMLALSGLLAQAHTRNHGGFLVASDANIASHGFPARTAASVVMLSSVYSQAQCSGVVISDEGHIATAYHCLASCLVGQGWFTPQPVEIHTKTGDTWFMYFHDPRAKNIRCPLSLMSLAGGEFSGLTAEVEVVQGPTCLIFQKPRPTAESVVSAPDDMFTDALTGEPVMAACDRSRDMVVIRVGMQNLPHAKCSKLASAEPNLNNSLMALSFPYQTFRGSGDSTGKTLFASFGNRIQQNACSVEYESGTLWTTFNFELHQPLIQTTTDLVPRSSGGPLFNSDGEVVGIASSIVSPQHFGVYCRGASLFANTKWLDSQRYRCSQ